MRKNSILVTGDDIQLTPIQQLKRLPPRASTRLQQDYNGGGNSALRHHASQQQLSAQKPDGLSKTGRGTSHQQLPSLQSIKRTKPSISSNSGIITKREDRARQEEEANKYLVGTLGPKLSKMNQLVQQYVSQGNAESGPIDLEERHDTLTGFKRLQKKFGRADKRYATAAKQRQATIDHSEQQQSSPSKLRSRNLRDNMQTLPAIPYADIKQAEQRSRSVLNSLRQRQDRVVAATSQADQVTFEKLSNVNARSMLLLNQTTPGKVSARKEQPKPEYGQQFPLKKIDVWQQNQEDRDAEHQVLAERLKEEAEKVYPTSIKPEQASRKIVENELLLLAKLTKINKLMQQYFASNQDIVGQNTVVKLKDVAQYPTRATAAAYEKRIQHENKLYGAIPGGIQKVKYRKQLHPGPKIHGHGDADRVVRQFLEGKVKVHDHQGNEMSTTGTRMDRVARMAVPEDKARRLLNDQRLKTMRMYDDDTHQANFEEEEYKSDSDDDGFWDEIGDFTEIDQATLLASVNRKRRTRGTDLTLGEEIVHRYVQFMDKRRAQLEREEAAGATPRKGSHDGTDEEALISSPLKELLTVDQQMRGGDEADTDAMVTKLNEDFKQLVNMSRKSPQLRRPPGQTHKEDEIATYDDLPVPLRTDLRHLINEIRRFHIIKSQSKLSGKFFKKFGAYQRALARKHSHLRNQLADHKYARLDTGLERAMDDGISTVAGETQHASQVSQRARVTQRSGWTAADQNAQTINNTTFGSSFMATSHRPTSERFDQTMHDFRQQMQKQREKASLGRKPKVAAEQQDLLERLADVQLAEMKQMQREEKERDAQHARQQAQRRKGALEMIHEEHAKLKVVQAASTSDKDEAAMAELKSPLQMKRNRSYLKRQDQYDFEMPVVKDVDKELKQHDIEQSRRRIFGGIANTARKQLEAAQEHLRDKEQRKRKQRFVMQNVVKEIKAYNVQNSTFKELMKDLGKELKKRQDDGTKSSDSEHQDAAGADAAIEKGLGAMDDVQERSTPGEDADDTQDLEEEVNAFAKRSGIRTRAVREAELRGLKFFLLECEKQRLAPRVVLKRLKNKTLSFPNVKLERGLVKALTAFMKQAGKGGLALDSVSFAKNDVADSLLAEVLGPLSARDARAKSVVIADNNVGERTGQQLLKIITGSDHQHKQFESFLETFIINECHLQVHQQLPLMLQGLRENCAMRLMVLGLAGQVLDAPVADELMYLIAEMKQLRVFDISYSRIVNWNHFVDVLQALERDNNSIQYLNIGGLAFHIPNESSLVPPKPKKEAPKKEEFDYGGGTADKKPEPPVERSLSILTKLITKPQSKLTHLNLSGCFPGLQCLQETKQPFLMSSVIQTKAKDDADEEPFCQLTYLFESISHSKTLQAVHYSGNSINQYSLAKIEKILGVVPDNGFMTTSVNKNKSELDKALGGDLNEEIDVKKVNELIQAKLNNPQEQRSPVRDASPLLSSLRKKGNKGKRQGLTIIEDDDDMSRDNDEDILNSPVVKRGHSNLKQEFPYDRDVDRASKLSLSPDICTAEAGVPKDDRLVFSRFLGHREVINGHKWSYRRECWICEEWKYTLIVWSSSLASSSTENGLFERKEPFWLNKWEKELMNKNELQSYKQIYSYEKNLEENINRCPRICGPATNFKFRQMMTMPKFVDAILGNRRPWLRIYEEEVEVERLAEVNEAKKRALTPEDIEASNREWPYLVRDYLNKGDRQSLVDFDRLIKQGVAANERFFCHADFYPPRKPIELAIQKNGGSSKLSVIKQSFGVRESRPPVKYKSIKRMRMQRRFKLADSLFRSWKVDLSSHFRKCLKADMYYAKVHKFVKEKTEYDKVFEVLLEYYKCIYEQYVFGQGVSNYPTVGMNDFTRMCKNWGVIAKDLTTSDVDRLFVQVNFEEVQGQQEDLDDNPDKELCRYEFVEILVRMAKEKYEKRKLNLSVADATRKLLAEHVEKFRLEQTWHELRERDIWTLEVHDVLDANKEQLRVFMQWWIKTQSMPAGRKVMHIEELTDMLKMYPRALTGDGDGPKTFAQETRLTEQALILCFANAKFIITDEMKDADKLYTIKYDEFLEFVVRLANLANFDGPLSAPAGDGDNAKDAENGGQAEGAMDGGGGLGGNEEDSQMPIEEKVFETIDLILRLCKDPRTKMRAVRPQVKGLGDSESDYDD